MYACVFFFDHLPLVGAQTADPATELPRTRSARRRLTAGPADVDRLSLGNGGDKICHGLEKLQSPSCARPDYDFTPDSSPLDGELVAITGETTKYAKEIYSSIYIYVVNVNVDVCMYFYQLQKKERSKSLVQLPQPPLSILLISSLSQLR